MRQPSFFQFAAGLLLAMVAAGASAQCVSLTTAGVAYTQNFDTLSNTAGSTTNNLTITGWFMTETGGGARDNEQYAVDTGASNTGDTFSYGSAGNTNRALGGLQSGTLIPNFGACFTNNTGTSLTQLDFAYVGEQWRLGTTARTDQINFEYSTNATDLVTGTWTGVAALNFVSPDTGTTGAKNGDGAANRTALSNSVAPLAPIANGATFWIRWVDVNASGADDGLAVDDFSLTPQAAAGAPNLSINDVTLAEGNGGTVTFQFTVSLSAPAGPGGVTFDIATADNTATTANNDYVTNSLTGQTIPAGASTYAFNVTVNGDTAFESNETFFVNVTNVTGASVVDGQGTGTITNDDAQVVSVAATTASVAENAGAPLVYTISLAAAQPTDLAVNITCTGTASPGTDYPACPAQVTVPANQPSATLNIVPINDGVHEAAQTVIVTVAAGAGYTPDPVVNGAVGTITNDDPVPQANFVAATSNVTEGNAGTANHTVAVALDGTSEVALELNYSTSDGGGTNADATAGSDYVDTSGTLAFAALATGGNIIVPIIGDAVVEPSEDFTVGISPVSVTGQETRGLAASHVVTIADNDVASVASIAVAPASALESNGPFTFTVTLSPAPAVDTAVNFTVGGTATAGADYTAPMATSVTVLAAQSTAAVVVPVIDDALAGEGNETVVLTLAAGAGYTLGAPDAATATIQDNDSPVASVTVAPAAVPEDSAGNLVYTVALSNASVGAVTVPVVFSGTATGGVDYTGAQPSVTFPAGSNAAQTITVTSVPDFTVEPDETVIATLQAGAGYTVDAANGAATGTITNDDTSADLTYSISDSPDPVASGGTITYVVTITNAGPSPAANVQMSFQLPAGVSFGTLSGTPAGWTCTTSPTAVGCTNPSLPVGSSVFTITGIVPANAAAGTIYGATGNVTSTTTDPATANNTAAISTAVIGGPTAIPSLDAWGRLLLVLGFALLAFWAGRARNAG